MVLDLEDLEQKPTNKIDGFSERLKELFPGMFEHSVDSDVWQLAVYLLQTRLRRGRA